MAKICRQALACLFTLSQRGPGEQRQKSLARPVDEGWLEPPWALHVAAKLEEIDDPQVDAKWLCAVSFLDEAYMRDGNVHLEAFARVFHQCPRIVKGEQRSNE
jgi:hypothetical protein